VAFVADDNGSNSKEQKSSKKTGSRKPVFLFELKLLAQLEQKVHQN
jgi:hypothetical protein